MYARQAALCLVLGISFTFLPLTVRAQTPDPALLNLARVHPNDAPVDIFLRQLFYAPQTYGYEGRSADREEKDRWAFSTAMAIAHQYGYWVPDGSPLGKTLMDIGCRSFESPDCYLLIYPQYPEYTGGDIKIVIHEGRDFGKWLRGDATKMAPSPKPSITPAPASSSTPPESKIVEKIVYRIVEKVIEKYVPVPQPPQLLSELPPPPLTSIDQVGGYLQYSVNPSLFGSVEENLEIRPSFSGSLGVETAGASHYFDLNGNFQYLLQRIRNAATATGASEVPSVTSAEFENTSGGLSLLATLMDGGLRDERVSGFGASAYLNGSRSPVLFPPVIEFRGDAAGGIGYVFMRVVYNKEERRWRLAPRDLLVAAMLGWEFSKLVARPVFN